MNELTHFNSDGKAHMVDVGLKQETLRLAHAAGVIKMNPSTFNILLDGASKKGDVLGVARIAAIQGAKRCADLIPLCHPISLTSVAVDFLPDHETSSLQIDVICQTLGRTGVEMEALSAVGIGLLTVYDMLKSIDKGMEIKGIRLLKKDGGKSGMWMACAP